MGKNKKLRSKRKNPPIISAFSTVGNDNVKKAPGFIREPGMLSASLLLKSQPIGDKGDELAVGRLALMIVNSVSEKGVYGVYFAPAPGDLNGVADSSFNP